MDLTSTFTDDQVAVMGCFAALAVCGLIGLISFHFGPKGKRQQSSDAPNSVRLPVSAASTETDSRKAA